MAEEKVEKKEEKSPPKFREKPEKKKKAEPGFRMEKQKSRWWKYLLCFIGGILFTIGGIVGGLAITASGVKTGDLLGEYADQFLTLEYQKKTLLDIVMDFVGGKVEVNNLEDIAAITPFVNAQLETINQTLSENLGFTIDITEMNAVSFADLGDYLSEQFTNNITLAGALKVDENSAKLLQYFAYDVDEEGHIDYTKPYPISSFMGESGDFIDSIINRITVGDIVGESTDNSYFIQAISGYTIEDLKKQETLESITIKDLFDPDDVAASTLLSAIGDWQIGDFSSNDKINSLTVGTLFGVDDDYENKDTILYAIRNKTIGMLKDDSTAFDDLTIGQLMTIDDGSSPVLKYLKDKTIGQLKNDDIVKDMEISDVIEDDSSALINALKTMKRYYMPTLNEEEDGMNFTPSVVQVFEGEDTIPDGPHDGLSQANPFTVAEAMTAMDSIEEKELLGPRYIYGTLSGTKYTTDGWEGVLDHKLLVKFFSNNSGASITNADGEFDGKRVIANGYVRRIDGTKVGDIGDNVYYLGLGTVISLDDSNPLMSSLKDKTIGEIPDAIKDLTINDVFTYSDFDSLPPILQTLLNRKTKITELEDAVKSLQLKDVVNIKKKEDGTYDESDPMYPLRECGLSSDSIWNKIKTEYTIDMFVDVDESSPYFLKQLVNEHVAIGDLSTTLNTWKLNKFIEITSSSPKMLQFLQDYTLSELSTTNFMETMTIGDVLTDTELSASKFLTLIPSTTLITGIGGAIDGIKILDLFEDQIYQEDGGVLVVNATWKYMLFESDETFPTGTLTKASEPFAGKKCENYTIGNSMNQMVENMKNNIGRASMFNLTGDGLVSLTPEATAFLNTYITFYPGSVAEARYKAEWDGKKYGDLPIDIFVDLMINNLP